MCMVCLDLGLDSELSSGNEELISPMAIFYTILCVNACICVFVCVFLCACVCVCVHVRVRV